MTTNPPTGLAALDDETIDHYCEMARTHLVEGGVIANIDCGYADHPDFALVWSTAAEILIDEPFEN